MEKSCKFFSKRVLTDSKLNDIISLALRNTTSEVHKWICRGIEVVITRRSWKPFVRKGAWVRIPPSALQLKRFYENNRWGCFSMKKSCYSGYGEIPKRLKGLPWKGSRSLIAARGFKSLFLRFEICAKAWGKLKCSHFNLTTLANPQTCLRVKKILKKFKKSCWQAQ